ncbi:DEAD/DEAH box helicase [Daejeonella oryzae]|uniref:DEAD/DEAH box helicase n=1 Tax=Daejeonella oryzae TaxID=1122943 RepID=UPI000400EB39|nr:DEAD/DEAH box helicase [Daejeonella oryzae]
MLLEKLKLSKPLVRAMTEAGYLGALEIQAKTMSRIIGGQDIIAVAPEGSGKTTSYVLGVLMRLKYGVEEAPRAIILVPDKERVLAVMEKFELLNKNKSIRTVGLYSAPGIESQMDALADGTDIVIATPDRARALYLKLGLNLNKIIMFIVDDAETIIKKGLQLPVVELARSIIKCQHLVFTEVVHEKLNMMIDPFMSFPTTIEVSGEAQNKMETYPQLLFRVPNFRTKINLLNNILQDSEEFRKVAVFVNTRLTAQKIYKSLIPSLEKEAGVLNPLFFDDAGFNSLEEFKGESAARIIIIATEGLGSIDLKGIQTIIHFDVPEEKEILISRIVKPSNIDNDEVIAITFSTDIELSIVKKIELATGQQMIAAELPSDLIIQTEPKKKKVIKSQDSADPLAGAAFHEKKESNSKTYNFGSGEKAKMTRKKKHS